MNKNYKIVHGKDLTEQNIASSHQIDKLVYKEEYIGILDTYIKWFRKNHEICSMIVQEETEQTIGYINIMPIKQEFYKKYVDLQVYDNSGLHDAMISVEDVETYDNPGFYNLLFVSFAAHPKYQTAKISKMLLNAFWDKLLILSQKGIFINNILGDTVSGSGEKISKLLAFNFLKSTNYGTNLYELNIPKFLKNYNEKNSIILELKYNYLNKSISIF